MSDPFDALPTEAREKLRQQKRPRWTDPMLATLTDERFSDPDWIYERKRSPHVRQPSRRRAGSLGRAPGRSPTMSHRTELDVPGRSRLSKRELVAAIRARQ